MPDLVTSAQAELARQMAAAEAQDGGGTLEVQADRDSAGVTVAGDIGDHWTVGAYARYYWDKTTAWTAGAWARFRWGA